MSRRWLPEAEFQHQRRVDAASAVAGGALAAAMFMRKKPPLRWTFFGYLKLFTLWVALGLACLSVLITLLAVATTSIQDAFVAQHGLPATLLVAFTGAGAFGQVLAVVLAAAVFAAGIPVRQVWAAERAAGWTPKQCLAAYRGELQLQQQGGSAPGQSFQFPEFLPPMSRPGSPLDPGTGRTDQQQR